MNTVIRRLARRPVITGILLAVSILTPTAALATGDARAGGGVDLEVRGSTDFASGALMPGDQLEPRTIELTAAGDLLYGLRVEWSGSEALADTIQIAIHDADGDVLYAGPLSEAAFGPADGKPIAGEKLADGESVMLTISGELPLSAGNEIQGTAVHARWEAVAVADPSV